MIILKVANFFYLEINMNIPFLLYRKKQKTANSSIQNLLGGVAEVYREFTEETD